LQCQDWIQAPVFHRGESEFAAKRRIESSRTLEARLQRASRIPGHSQSRLCMFDAWS